MRRRQVRHEQGQRQRVALGAGAASAAPPPKIVDGPLPAITAGVKFGEKPTVAKGSGEPSKDLAVKTVIAGSGKTVAENDYVQANYLGQIWDTGEGLRQLLRP